MDIEDAIQELDDADNLTRIAYDKLILVCREYRSLTSWLESSAKDLGAMRIQLSLAKSDFESEANK